MGFLFINTVFIHCRPIATDNVEIKDTLAEYIKTYQKRENFQDLLSFYDNNFLYYDMILGRKAKGKEDFVTLLNWDNPYLKSLGKQTYEVDELIVQENKAIIIGYFNPFEWHGEYIEHMQFTTILTFNSNNEIIKHINWINYPQHVKDLAKRGNSNDWIGAK